MGDKFLLGFEAQCMNNLIEFLFRFCQFSSHVVFSHVLHLPCLCIYLYIHLYFQKKPKMMKKLMSCAYNGTICIILLFGTTRMSVSLLSFHVNSRYGRGFIFHCPETC